MKKQFRDILFAGFLAIGLFPVLSLVYRRKETFNYRWILFSWHTFNIRILFIIQYRDQSPLVAVHDLVLIVIIVLVVYIRPVSYVLNVE